MIARFIPCPVCGQGSFFLLDSHNITCVASRCIDCIGRSIRSTSPNREGHIKHVDHEAGAEK